MLRLIFLPFQLFISLKINLEITFAYTNNFEISTILAILMLIFFDL